MKVIILVDHTILSDRYLIAEHGLSTLIESHGYQVIFNTGYSNAVITNADKLGINPIHPN